jgi:peroxiredoxin
LEYLALAINERKFINLNYLKGNIYFVLKDNEKFLMLLDTIKKNTGIGENAKEFAINLLNGKKIKLSDYKGRVVLIDFWAVWCPPCREGIPFFKELYSKNKDKGFEIIGISLDTDEKKLNDFLKEKAIDWRISYSGKGWYDDTAKLYNVSTIPSIWIIDKSGKLRYFDVHKEDMKKAVVKLINEQIE